MKFKSFSKIKMKMNKIWYGIVTVFVVSNFCYCDELLPIKIVEEPVITSIGGGAGNNVINVYNRRYEQSDDNLALKATHLPANFSGPSQLKELDGKCFDYFSSNYKWVVCPFQNVTQYEQIIRWNAYKGILGIWYEWEIENDRFKGLVMSNGDDCGEHGRRQTKIHFECSNTTFISDITEPKTCNYNVTFKTPLVCRQNILLVYPALSESLQHEWDVLYTDYQNEILTEKAYNKSLRILFEQAGFYRKKEENEWLLIKRKNSTEDLNKPYVAQSLPECQKEVNRLREEIKVLKTLKTS